MSAAAPATAPASVLTVPIRVSGHEIPVTIRQREDGRIAWKLRAGGATYMGKAAGLFGAIAAARDCLQCCGSALVDELDEPEVEKLLEASLQQALYRKTVGR